MGEGSTEMQLGQNNGKISSQKDLGINTSGF